MKPFINPFDAQSHGVMETIMEHLAFEVGADPLEFRLNNMLQPGDSMLENGPFVGPNQIPNIVESLKAKANFDDRMQQLQTFNLVRDDQV